MKPHLKSILIWSFLLSLAPVIALAQGADCPDIVKQALAAAEQMCQATGRNQACYGNVDMTAEAQPGVVNFKFNAAGDIVDVASLQKLVLSPMDTTNNKWGVALLKLQANLPDTLPGQNVTFLLFGDVQITNGVTAGSDLRPMQAFYLKTGIGDAQCKEAPESGMLVQTPQGAGEVTFNVNGVDVQMGSTVFFQAEAKKQMTVSTLQGAAFIKAQGRTQVIVPGTWASIPLVDPFDLPSGGGGDNNPSAQPQTPETIAQSEGIYVSGEPSELHSYENQMDKLNALPLDLLEEPVEIAPPLSEEEVQKLEATIEDRINSGEPLCGEAPLPSCESLNPSSDDSNNSQEQSGNGEAQNNSVEPPSGNPPDNPPPSNDGDTGGGHGGGDSGGGGEGG